MPLVSDSFYRPSFTLEQIRTFLAVAAREHLTHAAKALNLSQPAVTQQIQLLERGLGVRLLERVGRNVRLTDAGVEVAGACLLIMRSLENLENVVEAVCGLQKGSLYIGASQVAASYYLSRPLTDFASEHPAIDIDITIANTCSVCEQVAGGRLECGLVDGPVPETDLVCAEVASDEVVLVTSPTNPLARKNCLNGDDLMGHARLIWEPGSATETIAEEMIGAAYSKAPAIQLASLEAVRQSLLATPCFMAAMPKVAVEEELRRRVLARVGGLSRSRAIYAVRRPGPDCPAVEAFWKLLSKEEPGMP